MSDVLPLVLIAVMLAASYFAQVIGRGQFPNLLALVVIALCMAAWLSGASFEMSRDWAVPVQWLSCLAIAAFGFGHIVLGVRGVRRERTLTD